MLETRGVYPNLQGRSVLVIEEGDMKSKYQGELQGKQKMAFAFKGIHVIDNFLPLAVSQFGYEAVVLHIPVMSNKEKLLEQESVTRQVKDVCPRLVIATGEPVYQIVKDLYSRLGIDGFNLVSKYNIPAVAKKLSELF